MQRCKLRQAQGRQAHTIVRQAVIQFACPVLPVFCCPTAPFAPRSIHLITASRWLAFFSVHLLSFGPSLAVTAAAAAAVYFNLVNVSLSLFSFPLFKLGVLFLLAGWRLGKHCCWCPKIVLAYKHSRSCLGYVHLTVCVCCNTTHLPIFCSVLLFCGGGRHLQS